MTTNSSPVSVCIPCFNAGPFLERCLTSALREVYPSDEIVFIDDGSTDDSFLIAQHLLRSNDTVMRQENMGPGATRNRLLKVAGREYVIFLDADDEIAPNGLKYLRGQAHNSDLVYGDALYVDPDGSWLRLQSQAPQTADSVVNMVNCAPMTSTVLIRKAAVPEAWNERYNCCDEYFFFLCFALRNRRLTHIPFPTAKVREHSTPTRRTVAAGRSKSHIPTLLSMTWNLREFFLANHSGSELREAYFSITMLNWMVSLARQGSITRFGEADDIRDYLGNGYRSMRQWFKFRRKLPRMGTARVVKAIMDYWRLV